MNVILLNDFFGAMMIILTIICVGAFIYSIIGWMAKRRKKQKQSDQDSYRSYSAKKEINISGRWPIISAILAVVFALLAAYNTTHTLVPANSEALVINKSTSRPAGGMRHSGVASVPFMSTVIDVPAEQNRPECHIYTPSIRGGAEVAVNVCFFYNAAKVDWMDQFAKYNYSSYKNLTDHWWNLTASDVAIAIKDYNANDLTNNRGAVEKSIVSQVTPIFQQNGIPLNSVTLNNWDFTNPDLRKSYDAAAVAQGGLANIQSQQQLAEQQRTLDLYKQETQNLVLAKQAEGVKQFLQSIGVSDPTTIKDILTVLYLQNLPNPPQNVILSTGGSSAPQVSVPAVTATTPAAIATAAPKK